MEEEDIHQLSIIHIQDIENPKEGRVESPKGNSSKKGTTIKHPFTPHKYDFVYLGDN